MRGTAHCLLAWLRSLLLLLLPLLLLPFRLRLLRCLLRRMLRRRQRLLALLAQQLLCEPLQRLELLLRGAAAGAPTQPATRIQQEHIPAR